MVSRENTVILVCIALTVPVLFAVNELTNAPAWVGGAVLIGVGVVVPLLINDYLDKKAEEG